MVEIIAEIGNTHEGSLELAKCFIHTVSKCGVDAVKFQFHIFEEESLNTAPNPPYFQNESRQEYFSRTSFSQNQWSELRSFSKDLGLKFYCSPFSILAAKILNDVNIDGFKIASGEVTNLPLLECIAKFQKPIIISSGMSRLSEVLDAKSLIFKEWADADLTCLQCTSKYPCPPEQSGISFINELKMHFDRVGFSDHTTGIASAIMSISQGAKVIEKHFTLSKNMYGPDASFSLEPDQMLLFVNEIRDSEKVYSSKYSKDDLDDYLNEMKITFQKSIVANIDLAAGTKLSSEHLAYKKPFVGISAAEYKNIIGRVLKRNIKRNAHIKYDNLLD